MSLKVLDVAAAEVGYLEKKSNASLDLKTANAGSNNYTKYARDLDKLSVYNGKKQGLAYCDIFVDWCFIKAYGLENGLKLLCQPKGGAGAGCTFSARYYQDKGQFHKKNPKPGDQIFFSKDGGKTCYHTGLVEKVANGNVYTIEGNTSGRSGVIANGNGVFRKSYSLAYSRIAGYGRPDYSKIDPDNYTVVQKRFDFADETMEYLAAYKHGAALIQRLATTKTAPEKAELKRTIVQNRFGFADETMDYLTKYKYGHSLLTKLATVK